MSSRARKSRPVVEALLLAGRTLLRRSHFRRRLRDDPEAIHDFFRETMALLLDVASPCDEKEALHGARRLRGKERSAILALLPEPRDPGLLYEQFLSLTPRLDPRTGEFSLVFAPGSVRKRLGSYSTPDCLIELLLRSTLDPVLALASHDDGVARELWASVYPIYGADELLRYDGASLVPVVSGARVFLEALASFDDGSGPALFVGGSRLSITGAPALAVGKWNGSRWRPAIRGLPPGQAPGVKFPPEGEQPFIITKLKSIPEDAKSDLVKIENGKTALAGIARRLNKARNKWEQAQNDAGRKNDKNGQAAAASQIRIIDQKLGIVGGRDRDLEKAREAIATLSAWCQDTAPQLESVKGNATVEFEVYIEDGGERFPLVRTTGFQTRSQSPSE